MSKFYGCIYPFLLAALLLTAPGGSLQARENGKGIFLRYCSQCHGLDGRGFRALYPSLYGSQFFSRKLPSLPCVIRNGLKGEIKLDGGGFNRTMPGNPILTIDQIASLMGYTVKFAPHGQPYPSAEDVGGWLEQCPQPETGK